MILYGLALLPLAEVLQEEVPDTLQPWYADDMGIASPAAAVGKAMDRLLQLGPDRGYFPEPSKSILICSPTQLPTTQHTLAWFNFGFTDGHRYVGGFLGCDTARQEWLEPQIQ